MFFSEFNESSPMFFKAIVFSKTAFLIYVKIKNKMLWYLGKILFKNFKISINLKEIGKMFEKL